MKLPRRKHLYWGLSLVLLVLLAACSKTTQPGVSENQNTGGVITTTPGLPQVQIPEPLGVKEGLVPLNMGVSSMAAGDQVQLKFLVIASDAGDFGLDTWKAILDRVGAPYDVFLAQNTPLTSSSLIDSDGTGKYSAILLTNHSLLDPATFTSYFDGVEWNTLWDYERNYKVRQVSLYTSYGTFPEDYCLRPVSEGGVGNTPLNATLTASGARIFPELKSTVQIPIVQSYVYRNSIAAGCNATAILNAGGNVLGVISPSTDGRERLALSFTSNVNLLQSSLLTYGLMRWASKGVFLGERKHYIQVDVDDWFNTTDERLPNGTFVPGGYRMSAQDAWSAYLNQETTVLRYWNALSNFYLNIAYNAGDADLSAPNNFYFFYCNTRASSPDPLTSTSRCLRNGFRWINHTLTHPKFNDPNLATAAVINQEIRENIRIGAAGNVINQNGVNYASLGLRIADKTVLKTPEYSGLGVYHPDPNNDIDPPTDYGLLASNPNLLSEAKAFGIKYLHGNMSFASHRPACFNCGIYHPMEPSLLIVPDWPTNIAYLATTPAEEESIYNCFFGPNATCAGGQFRYWPQNLTYAQVIEAETDLAFQQHVATGSVYTHTMHVGNLREYSPGKNMVMDWVGRLAAKYTTYYNTPLRNLDWASLGQYVAYRTSHFSTLAGTKAVWDRATNRVTVSSSNAGTLYLTGATVAGASSENYGGNTISRLTLAAGVAQTLTPASYVSGLAISAQDLPEDSVGEIVREPLK